MHRVLAAFFLLVLLVACGGGQGPTSPGRGVQYINSFNPPYVPSESPTPFTVWGAGLGPVGQGARVHFEAVQGTPFDGGLTAHKEFPATITSATRVDGTSAPCGTSEGVRVWVTLILPDGTTLALPEDYHVFVNEVGLFNTGLESVTPRVPEDLEVEGNGFGPLEENVTLEFTAREGTPFEGGDSSTMELNAEVVSESLLRARWPYTRVSGSFEADLVARFPSGAVAEGISYAFAEGAQVSATDTAGVDRFGESVAADGSTIVVGAPGADAAYVYVRGNGTWPLEQRLSATGGAAGDAFGSSVAVSGDTIIVGAVDAGKAYAFRRSGTTWTQDAVWSVPTDPIGFGKSVSIEGQTAAISRFSTTAGVQVHSRIAGTWTPVTWLQPSTATEGFGRSIGYSNDTVVAGAYLDDGAGTDAGAVFVFEQSGGIWYQKHEFEPAAGSDNLSFGHSVAASWTHFAASAPGETSTSGRKGVVYLYRTTLSGWVFDARIEAPVGAERLLFGSAVALHDKQLVVGAPADGDSHGALYVYEYETGSWVLRATLRPWWPSPFSMRLGTSVSAGVNAVVGGSPSTSGIGHICVY